MSLLCPNCGSNSGVKDTRGNYRKRVCTVCKAVFYTKEIPVDSDTAIKAMSKIFKNTYGNRPRKYDKESSKKYRDRRKRAWLDSCTTEH